MNNYVRGYRDDAGLDIIMDRPITIKPGFQAIELPASYCPGKDEVAFVVSRGSTASKGIFPFSVAIDSGYTGLITTWVYNSTNETQEFKAGDRIFGIVNLKLGKDRVDYMVSRPGKRGVNKLGSSGGQDTCSNVKYKKEVD